MVKRVYLLVEDKGRVDAGLKTSIAYQYEHHGAICSVVVWRGQFLDPAPEAMQKDVVLKPCRIMHPMPYHGVTLKPYKKLSKVHPLERLCLLH
jgi:hypothetical protein